MKIRPVGVDLFRADGQTDMAKLIAAFFSSSLQKILKKIMLHNIHYLSHLNHHVTHKSYIRTKNYIYISYVLIRTNNNFFVLYTELTDCIL
jgi:hypothetical protein